MSRMTIVGSPLTAPMTRLSPAGTGAVHRSREGGPRVGAGALGGAVTVEGVAPGAWGEPAAGECEAEGAEPPQAARRIANSTAAPLPRTGDTVPGSLPTSAR